MSYTDAERPDFSKSKFISRYGFYSKYPRQADIREAFLSQMANDLSRTDRPKTQVSDMAEFVYQLMIRPGLAYHVPLHPLTMIESAEIYHIPLTLTQRLAIWFHDAIYEFGSPTGQSEHLSALLSRTFIDYPRDESVSSIILHTAKWGETYIPGLTEDIAVIMDLDLIHFVWDWDLLRETDEAVGIELRKIFGDDYRSKRKTFWQMFVDRGFIYRSLRFRNDPYLEPVAMNNVKAMLEDCE